jgi:type I restriction enzyme M protein
MNENLFSKIWNIASVFRNEGMSDHLYLEQITNLLFLKMIDEQKNIPAALANGLHNIAWPEIEINKGEKNEYIGEGSWQALSTGNSQLQMYTEMLKKLGESSGILKEIYRNSRNEIQQEKTLKQVVDNINKMGNISDNQEALAKIYEELMRRVSENTTSTNGQYFTPRALIDVIVQCVNPQIGSTENIDEKGMPKDWKTVADPCCGTGGFLIAAKNFMTNDKPSSEVMLKLLATSTFHGVEIERATYKLALMNMLLHNIGGYESETLPIECRDSLMYSVKDKVDYVLTNPPFGKSGSIKVTVKKTDKKTGEEKIVEENQREDYSLRKDDDFVDTSTSSKQLLFVQHIISMLKDGGTAAVVLPDNVLFEGGSGERVRRHLVSRCNLHTILRLPSGIFYAQGIKANVLFFTKMPASKEEYKTPCIWVYDYRAKIHHTLKTNPLKASDLDDFIKCYNPKNIEKRTATYTNENPDGRWRCYEWSEIKDRSDLNFDFKWLKDDDDQYADLSLSELVENYESQLLALNESFKVLKDEISTLLT